VKLESIKILKVFLQFSNQEKLFVGRLALKDRTIWFEYDSNFLNSGFEISPFKLALKAGAVHANAEPFSGLFGVFNDSLPDGWGRLLVDRKLRSLDIDPNNLSDLDRLSLVGSSGMGALCYEPENPNEDYHSYEINLDNLAAQAFHILEGSSKNLDKLVALNASSAGARPKINICFSPINKQLIHPLEESLSMQHQYWLIKFPSSQDPKDIGAIEYSYNLMAQRAGLEISDCSLFESKNGPGYFGTKRFDRNSKQRLHVHSVAGLLDADHRYPSLDYENLLKAALVLTKDINQVIKLYHQAVFNVYTHNRDDHSKNFSFLMDEVGNWRVSPAYDLTFSSGPGGEHSMLVCGEGKNPGDKELIKLAKQFGIKNYQEIIESTKEAVSQWNSIAKENGVSKESIKMIASKLTTSP